RRRGGRGRAAAGTIEADSPPCRLVRPAQGRLLRGDRRRALRLLAARRSLAQRRRAGADFRRRRLPRAVVVRRASARDAERTGFGQRRVFQRVGFFGRRLAAADLTIARAAYANRIPFNNAPP